MSSHVTYRQIEEGYEILTRVGIDILRRALHHSTGKRDLDDLQRFIAEDCDVLRGHPVEARQGVWLEGPGCAKQAKRGLVLAEYIDGHPERAGILRAHILCDVLKQRHGACPARW